LSVRGGGRMVVILALVICSCGGDTTIDRLRNGTPAQRAEAAAFLGAQGVSEAIPALREALEDTVEDVQAKVIWALGSLRAKASLSALIPLIASASRRIRQQAVQALAQLEEPEVIPALEAALNVEKDPWVRKDIQEALQHLRQFQGETDLSQTTFRW